MDFLEYYLNSDNSKRTWHKHEITATSFPVQYAAKNQNISRTTAYKYIKDLQNKLDGINKGCLPDSIKEKVSKHTENNQISIAFIREYLQPRHINPLLKSLYSD